MRKTINSDSCAIYKINIRYVCRVWSRRPFGRPSQQQLHRKKRNKKKLLLIRVLNFNGGGDVDLSTSPSQNGREFRAR